MIMVYKMEKLYYRDRYLKEIITEITKIENIGDKFGVVLKDDIVFPGGGGQAGDISFISKNAKDFEPIQYNIEKVIEDEDNGNIHILDEIHDFKVGDAVKILIDWSYREDNMHQHTGQHILSGCFYKLFKKNTTGLHIGKYISQLDIEGIFDDDMVEQVEKYANEVINESIEIENFIVKDRDTIFTRRKLPDTDNSIRILKIGELDTNACCGVHSKNTRDVGLIKIVKYYKHKDGTRFEYMAGKRAIDNVLNRERVFEKVLKQFNCNDEAVLNAIENIKNKNNEFFEEKKYIYGKLLPILSEKIVSESETNKDDIYIVKNKFYDEQKWYISDLSKYISDNYRAIVIFININKEKTDILLQCSKEISKKFDNIKLDKIFKSNAHIIGAKGGGSDFIAQGICEDSINIDKFIDAVLQKL